jgi:hypothetical protein
MLVGITLYIRPFMAIAILAVAILGAVINGNGIFIVPVNRGVNKI